MTRLPVKTSLTFHPAQRVLFSAGGVDAVRCVEGAVGLHQVLGRQPCHSFQRVYVLEEEGRSGRQATLVALRSGIAGGSGAE